MTTEQRLDQVVEQLSRNQACVHKLIDDVSDMQKRIYRLENPSEQKSVANHHKFSHVDEIEFDLDTFGRKMDAYTDKINAFSLKQELAEAHKLISTLKGELREAKRLDVPGLRSVISNAMRRKFTKKEMTIFDQTSVLTDDIVEFFSNKVPDNSESDRVIFVDDIAELLSREPAGEKKTQFSEEELRSVINKAAEPLEFWSSPSDFVDAIAPAVIGYLSDRSHTPSEQGLRDALYGFVGSWVKKEESSRYAIELANLLEATRRG